MIKPARLNQKPVAAKNYLVIGNALPETVVSLNPNKSRVHVGGVGAIMARELALAGAAVTLLTTAPTGAATQELADLLSNLPLQHIIVPGSPRQTQRSYAKIYTRSGKPVKAQGNFAPMGGLAAEIADLVPNFDWVLMSLNPMPRDISLASQQAANLTLNATAPSLTKRFLQAKRSRICTMNQQEANRLLDASKVNIPQNLLEKLKTDLVLVTNAANGYTIYRNGQPPQRHSAVPAPQGTDFVGAGDAATAGLAYAEAEGLDHAPTIDRFITNLLRRNAAAYGRN